MMDLLFITAAFALIVVLLRLRWNLGLVMFTGAVFLGALYRIGPIRQAQVVFWSSIDPETINLVVGLALIMVLENILRKRGVLKRMMDAVVNVAKDRRIAMAVLPAVIGLLPSAGGAAFSAPLVQEAAADEDIQPEQKTFINYWFRHVWEYISPLYPGVVLVVAITNVPIDKFILSQLPLTIASIVVGAFFGFRGMNTGGIEGKRDRHELKTLSVSLIPIIASIILVVVFKLPLAIAMTIVVVALLLFYRYSPQELVTTLRESLSLNVILMVIGIMVFKGMLDATGAIVALPAFFRESGMPTGVVLFALPFIVGLLTGFSAGYVGATFPIIAAMLGPNPDIGAMTFAYASGFAGVMLSPTHLCYLLTLRYFKADMAGSYRFLYLPVLLVLLVGLVRLWV